MYITISNTKCQKTIQNEVQNTKYKIQKTSPNNRCNFVIS